MILSIEINDQFCYLYYEILGSEEEKQDLIELYNKYEGDFDKISNCLIGYDVDEEERYGKILHDLIEKDEIASFPKFVNESSKKKTHRHKREKKVTSIFISSCEFSS